MFYNAHKVLFTLVTSPVAQFNLLQRNALYQWYYHMLSSVCRNEYMIDVNPRFWHLRHWTYWPDLSYLQQSPDKNTVKRWPKRHYAEKIMNHLQHIANANTVLGNSNTLWICRLQEIISLYFSRLTPIFRTGWVLNTCQVNVFRLHKERIKIY